MKNDPTKCSMIDCTHDLGPDALEFTHAGQPAGGICDTCIDNDGALKIVFRKEDGVFLASEITWLGGGMS